MSDFERYDLTPTQERECRYGVVIGEPSNRSLIIGPDPTEGRHVRWSSRTTPSTDWWVLMIRDQGTCSCEHGPRLWSVAFRGSTCGTCGKPPGRHRRPRADLMPEGTVYWSDPAERWQVANAEYPDRELVI